MKRTKKFYQIKDTATTLFKRFGFNRVTIEEICREANVSKMTFYKYFKNKNEFTKFIITDMIEESMKEYDSIMKEDIKYEEKVRKLIDLKMKGTMDISREFMADYLQNADEELSTFFNNYYSSLLKRFYVDLIAAKNEGNIRANIKTEFLLYILNLLIDLAKNETLKAMYDTPQQLIMELTNFYFYGIMEKNHR